MEDPMEFVVKLVKKFKEMQTRIIDLENEVLKLNNTCNAGENQSLISKRTKGQKDKGTIICPHQSCPKVCFSEGGLDKHLAAKHDGQSKPFIRQLTALEAVGGVSHHGRPDILGVMQEYCDYKKSITSQVAAQLKINEPEQQSDENFYNPKSGSVQPTNLPCAQQNTPYTTCQLPSDHTGSQSHQTKKMSEIMFEIQIVRKTETDELLSGYYPIRKFEDLKIAFNDFSINILSEANDDLYEYPVAIEMEIPNPLIESTGFFITNKQHLWEALNGGGDFCQNGLLPQNSASSSVRNFTFHCDIMNPIIFESYQVVFTPYSQNTRSITQ